MPIGPMSSPVAAPVKLPPLVRTMVKSPHKAKVMMTKWWPLTRSDGRPRRPATSAASRADTGRATHKLMPKSRARIAAGIGADAHQRGVADRHDAGLAEEDRQAVEGDDRRPRSRPRTKGAVARMQPGQANSRDHDSARQPISPVAGRRDLAGRCRDRTRWRRRSAWHSSGGPVRGRASTQSDRPGAARAGPAAEKKDQDHRPKE